jgi:hypothetical protein
MSSIFLGFPALACGGSIAGPQDAVVSDTPTDHGGEDPADVPAEEAPPPPSGRVDILVVVDDSGSMAAEQSNLRAAMPALIEALLDPPPDPVSGEPVHRIVRDLHLGVVSTNLGAGGFNVGGCEDLGDNGVLLHEPHGTPCETAYPQFLSYLIGDAEPPDVAGIDGLSADFGCIATLGTEGCGFEQPLEAAYKALVVNARPGGLNEGFLREDAILVIVIVSDEEDCSASDNQLFNLTGLTYPVNLRCFMEKDMLHEVDRYVDGFQGLKASADRVVVGMIVGVPPDPACNGRGSDLSGCLALVSMQEVVRPDGELLQYVCTHPTGCTPPNPPDPGTCMSEAFPGRRFVDLAQKMGENAIVRTICTSDYGPAMEAVAERVAEILQ